MAQSSQTVVEGHDLAHTVGTGTPLWRRLWARWKRFAQKIADFQARLILTVIYFLVVAPYGLVVRLVSDPLHVKRRDRPSMWIPRGQEDATIRSARRQF